MYKMPDIETITNNLADGYEELKEKNLQFQEASEVQIQRRTNDSLKNRWLYIANLPLFRVQDGNLEYGLSGRQTFDTIAGVDIQDFSTQILKNGVYVLTQSQTEQLEELAGDIVWAKADGLGLKRKNDAWSYFLIDTSDLNGKNLNQDQRPFSAKVYGSLDSKYDFKQESPDYGEAMKMLSGKISKTTIWLPNQDHIKKYVKNGDVVARASGLDSFDVVSLFLAGCFGVGSHGGLCGVPKIREADAPNLAS